MNLYVDSSALVKLLVEEKVSDLAAQVVDGAEVLFTSRLAYPEIRAAMAAALRGGRLQPASHRAVKSRLEKLWLEFDVVEATDEVARLAGDLAEHRALRGYDAIHLASALTVANTDDEFVLATWDRDLARAAVIEGVAVAPAIRP